MQKMCLNLLASYEIYTTTRLIQNNAQTTSTLDELSDCIKDYLPADVYVTNDQSIQVKKEINKIKVKIKIKIKKHSSYCIGFTIHSTHL